MGYLVPPQIRPFLGLGTIKSFRNEKIKKMLRDAVVQGPSKSRREKKR